MKQHAPIPSTLDNLSALKIPAPCPEEQKYEDGDAYLTFCISRFWQLGDDAEDKDKYLTPLQIASRNRMIAMLSCPLEKLRECLSSLPTNQRPEWIDAGSDYDLIKAVMGDLMELMDHYFFQSQVCPRTKLNILPARFGMTESKNGRGVSCIYGINQNNVEEGLGIGSITLYMGVSPGPRVDLYFRKLYLGWVKKDCSNPADYCKGPEEAEPIVDHVDKNFTCRNLSIGDLLQTLVHEMVHVWQKLVCKKRFCGRACEGRNSVRHNGLTGHGPAFHAMQNAIVDEMRRWDTPFGNDFFSRVISQRGTQDELGNVCGCEEHFKKKKKKKVEGEEEDQDKCKDSTPRRAPNPHRKESSASADKLEPETKVALEKEKGKHERKKYHISSAILRELIATKTPLPHPFDALDAEEVSKSLNFSFRRSPSRPCPRLPTTKVIDPLTAPFASILAGTSSSPPSLAAHHDPRWSKGSAAKLGTPCRDASHTELNDPGSGYVKYVRLPGSPALPPPFLPTYHAANLARSMTIPDAVCVRPWGVEVSPLVGHAWRREVDEEFDARNAFRPRRVGARREAVRRGMDPRDAFWGGTKLPRAAWEAALRWWMLEGRGKEEGDRTTTTGRGATTTTTRRRSSSPPVGTSDLDLDLLDGKLAKWTGVAGRKARHREFVRRAKSFRWGDGDEDEGDSAAPVHSTPRPPSPLSSPPLSSPPGSGSSRSGQSSSAWSNADAEEKPLPLPPSCCSSSPPSSSPAPGPSGQKPQPQQQQLALLPAFAPPPPPRPSDRVPPPCAAHDMETQRRVGCPLLSSCDHSAYLRPPAGGKPPSVVNLRISLHESFAIYWVSERHPAPFDAGAHGRGQWCGARARWGGEGGNEGRRREVIYAPG
ncbi:hypothetical protein MKZ38_009930 [Zalerion maritima]|uniref:Uncharacterized protein n=1 Tax=Zalerion maritima TaxID=339359 RepID=A0AAD5RSU9_9PEZI|nr:hypothetical protein MKZ38_009930 [Zalerion maritima]